MTGEEFEVPPHVYPSTCNPVDFARSVADGFESPVEWCPAPVCPPRTAEVETGGAL